MEDFVLVADLAAGAGLAADLAAGAGLAADLEAGAGLAADLEAGADLTEGVREVILVCEEDFPALFLAEDPLEGEEELERELEDEEWRFAGMGTPEKKR